MIKFKCGKCGENLEAPQSTVNEILQCPECGQKVIVPDNQEPPIAKKSGQPNETSYAILGGVMILLAVVDQKIDLFEFGPIFGPLFRLWMMGWAFYCFYASHKISKNPK